MNNTWKIYMLTLISFMVGTTQFSIVGMLDKIAASVGVSVDSGYCVKHKQEKRLERITDYARPCKEHGLVLKM